MECEADALAEIPLSRARRTEFMEAMLSFFGYHFDSIHSVRSISILREVF
jgi:DNA repair protein RecO (recombination protein O)